MIINEMKFSWRRASEILIHFERFPTLYHSSAYAGSVRTLLNFVECSSSRYRNLRANGLPILHLVVGVRADPGGTKLVSFFVKADEG